MTLSDVDRALYLGATRFIDKDADSVRVLAGSLRTDSDESTAIALFDWVRDQIFYDPLCAASDPPEMYVASAILERKRGYCVQKAVLLAALGRAAGIPSRLGFADVRNHQSPPSMRKLMGTDLFVFHGYTEFHLDGGWVKATPAFDRGSAARAGALLVELDGANDAMLHPVDPQGQPYIEYIRDRGSFADVPVDEILRTFDEVYGSRSQPD